MKLKINLKKILNNDNDNRDHISSRTSSSDQLESSTSTPSTSKKRKRLDNIIIPIKKKDKLTIDIKNKSQKTISIPDVSSSPLGLKNEYTPEPDVKEYVSFEDRIQDGEYQRSITPIEKSKKSRHKSKSLNIQRSYAPPKKKPLNRILPKLLETLSRRDDYMFFQVPVDTSLVPDYLNVIKEPMDFKTMSQNVRNDIYNDLDEFKRHFNLICNNAKLYNKPDTIFWKEADKLQQFGEKQIEKQRSLVMTIEEERKEREEAKRFKTENETIDEGSNHNGTAPPTEDGYTVKDEGEEDVDVGNDDGYLIPRREREESEEVMSEISSRRSPTPGITRRKKKTFKKKKSGFTYNLDGSIDADYLEDPFSLIPRSILSRPKMMEFDKTIKIENNSPGLTTFPHEREVTMLDYGSFTSSLVGEKSTTDTLLSDYQRYVYGDERGEAYIRSLEEFIGAKQQLENDELKNFELSPNFLRDVVYERINYLTRGIQRLLSRMGRELYIGEHPGSKLGSGIDNNLDRVQVIETEFGLVHFHSLIDQLRKWPEMRRAMLEIDNCTKSRLDLDIITTGHQELLQKVEGAKIDQISKILLENAEIVKELIEPEGEGEKYDEIKSQKMDELRKSLISVTKHVPLYDIYTKNLGQLNPSTVSNITSGRR